MTKAYLNTIQTAVPDFDIHQKFVEFAPLLLNNQRDKDLFHRMVKRSEIEHRYSVLPPSQEPEKLDENNFYNLDGFPGTQERMALYEAQALPLATRALQGLDLRHISHLLLTSCTGFYAPGLDWQIVKELNLNPSVERTIVGFMGCHAAINALKLARHIVRSDVAARVLIVNLELCTLHLQKTNALEEILSYLLFADGCAASVISGEPVGLHLKSFHSLFLPGTDNYITWNIGDTGFEMVLKGEVPGEISRNLPKNTRTILAEHHANDIAHWAVHPGGRTILDAVEEGLALDKSKLKFSRDVLRDYGNMSSATIMFVLKDMMEEKEGQELGCALAFGPGLTVESMMFEKEQYDA